MNNDKPNRGDWACLPYFSCMETWKIIHKIRRKTQLDTKKKKTMKLKREVLKISQGKENFLDPSWILTQLQVLVFSFLFFRYNLAGFLINIVFSSLFLGTQIPNVKVIWTQAGPQLMYGMIIAWGQWIVALVVTGALLVRVHAGKPKLYEASFCPLSFL